MCQVSSSFFISSAKFFVLPASLKKIANTTQLWGASNGKTEEIAVAKKVFLDPDSGD